MKTDQKEKEEGEIFWGIGDIQYLHPSGDHMGIYTCKNSSSSSTLLINAFYI